MSARGGGDPMAGASSGGSLCVPWARRDTIDAVRPPERPSRIAFGPFEVDLHTGELWRSGLPRPLQEQPFRVLALLLERPGELVTRDEIRQRLWPEALFTDFEHGLNKAVNKLRRALDDPVDDPRYVETLPRRGYRFRAALAGISGSPPVPSRLLYEGKAYPLLPGTNLIGRDPESRLCLDASSVSRRHAQVEVTESGVFLRDLASKNGTFRGGTRVVEPVPLADGDEIRVGTVLLLFRLAGHDSTATVASGHPSREDASEG
jgi:DNA-binding winged helix-turn-helix (wHTH) protein